MKFRLLFLLIFGFMQTFAQEEHINVLIENPSNQIKVINLHENGLLHLERSSNGVLKIKKFDNFLTEAWSITTDVPVDAELIDEFVDTKNLYLLMQPNRSNMLYVLKISTLFGGTQKFMYKTFPDFQVTHFTAFENLICIGGVVKKSPTLVLCDENNDIPKFISSSLSGDVLLQTLDIDSLGINVSFLNKEKKSTELIYRNYSKSGKILYSKTIPANDEYEFLSAKFFDLGTKHIFVGNYGFKGSSYNDFSSSQGIYVYDIDSKTSPNFYSFDKLKNFFAFLTENQKQKLEKIVQRKKDKGNEYRFDYRLLVNEVLSQNGKLLISAEVYMPVYRTNTSPYYGGLGGNNAYFPSSVWTRGAYYGLNSYSNPAMWGYNSRSLQYLDSFNFIEGVVLSINTNGELIWDQAVTYNNLRMYELKPHLKIGTEQNKTLLSYIDNGKLQAREINDQGEIGKNVTISKDAEFKSSKYQKTEFENFEYWYKNFFVNWGIEKNNAALNKKGVVSFIEKIPF